MAGVGLPLAGRPARRQAPALYKTSREQPALGLGFGDAADAEDEGGGAAAAVVLLLRLLDRVFGLGEHAVEFVEDLVLGPIVVLQVLQPLEVGDDDTARVAEHVRDQLDVAALLKDLVRLV